MLKLLAIPAQSKEIQAVGGYGKAGLPGNLQSQVDKSVQFRIKNSPAFCANYVGMRKRFVAVIAVASVRKAQFKNLFYLL